MHNDDRWAAAVEAKLGEHDNVLTAIQADMTQHIARGVVIGMKELINDKEVMKEFSKVLYDELTGHTINNTSQWIGKRLLTMIVSGVTIAGLVWLIKTGRIQ